MSFHRKGTLGGFLDPECRWYPCPAFGHAEYAHDLLDQIDPSGGLKRGAMLGLLGTDVLIKLGWLHVQHGYVVGDSRINDAQQQWLWNHVEELDPDMVECLRILDGGNT